MRINILFKIYNKMQTAINVIRGYIIPFNRKLRSKIIIEPLCSFQNPHWIILRGNNIIQRGTFLSAGNPNSIEIGENTTISRFSIIQSLYGFVKIGRCSQIGDFCNLYGQGGLEIGDNVMIASHVQIVPNQHTFSNKSILIKESPDISIGIKIEDDVWIGTNTVILDGISIGKGSIVAAGAVVNKSIPPYTVYGGVPAKLIKKR